MALQKLCHAHCHTEDCCNEIEDIREKRTCTVKNNNYITALKIAEVRAEFKQKTINTTELNCLLRTIAMKASAQNNQFCLNW